MVRRGARDEGTSGVRWFSALALKKNTLVVILRFQGAVERSVTMITASHSSTECIDDVIFISSDYNITVSFPIYPWHPLNAPSPRMKKKKQEQIPS